MPPPRVLQRPSGTRPTRPSRCVFWHTYNWRPERTQHIRDAESGVPGGAPLQHDAASAHAAAFIPDASRSAAARARHVEAIFFDDLQHAEEVQLKAFHRRGLAVRAQAQVAYLLAPLL
jgi:hypothetical protein